MENGCHVRRYTELWICSMVNESVNLFVEKKTEYSRRKDSLYRLLHSSSILLNQSLNNHFNSTSNLPSPFHYERKISCRPESFFFSRNGIIHQCCTGSFAFHMLLTHNARMSNRLKEHSYITALHRTAP